MLDLRWIVENQDLVKKSLEKRHHDSAILATLVEQDKARREAIGRQEAVRSRRNQLAKEIAEKKRAGANADALMEESRQNNSDLASLDAEVDSLTKAIQDVALRIPNVIHESVPLGKSDADNQEVARHGSPKQFSFKPLDHVDLGEKLGILEFERSSRMSGARFCSLIGKGARLNRAIIEFMLDLHTTQHGYTEILPPFLCNSNALIGTTQLPKFHQDMFKVENSDLYLISTGEIPVTNFHREEILAEADLPIRYTAYTPCFRSEAGSYGKDTRGMIRQHQFEKVELVIFSHPERSFEMHEMLKGHACEVLKRLDLPYREMLICSGDIGFGGTKQYDLEVWLPSQGMYREISSCSNFGDFQARRANIKFRPSGGGKPQFAHTLNGSGLAVGRTLVAILENFQHEDGSVTIPKALQEYTGFDRIEPRQ